MSQTFTHVIHPHIEQRKHQTAVKVADQLPTTGASAA